MKKSLGLFVVVALLIVVLVNVLADKFNFRLDLTDDARYTLSDATKSIISKLDEPVTITVYFTADMPPQLHPFRRELSDLLTEYFNASDGDVLFEFIDPGKNKDTEQQASKMGIKPVVINVREKDESIQKQVKMGVVLKMGAQVEVLPLIQPNSAIEYLLTTSIKKMSIKNKPLIGFVQGHGEASFDSFVQVMEGLKVMYKSEATSLTDTSRLDRYKTVILLNPTNYITPDEFQLLSSYLANGGNLLVAYNSVTLDNGNKMSGPMGVVVNNHLTDWLHTMGVEVAPAFVVDDNCGRVAVPRKQGAYTLNTQVKFPYIPIITNFAKHPIVTGLEAVVMQFASPLSYVGDSLVKFTVLATSSGISGIQQAPVPFDVDRNWESSDFRKPRVPVAGLFEGKLKGDIFSRLIVITDGDFPINGKGQQQKKIQPDNVTLFVNTVDWLSDDTGLISLRSQGANVRLLMPISEKGKQLIKWLNFLIPLALILVYGLFRNQQMRHIRKRRMEVDYDK